MTSMNNRRREELLRELRRRGVEKVRDVATFTPIPLAARSAGGLPLSWQQRRLWFLSELDGSAGRAYHMPGGLRLRGSLDHAALTAALDRIVARHEILRTTFRAGEAGPEQVVAPPGPFALVEEDWSGLAEAEVAPRVAETVRDETDRPFNLAAGPLARGRLMRVAADDHILLLNQHHIISDGRSAA